MAETPWLTIIGMGENGPDGLSPASQEALGAAQAVMAPARHLGLLPGHISAERVEWPAPFADGLPVLQSLRGQRVVVLASGDPFWFGAGSVIARHLAPGEWRALPGSSVFSLVAARLGWALERTVCLGLHAAPLSRMRPHLANQQRLIVLLRDGAAVGDLGVYLDALGFGDSTATVCEAMGGPRERVSTLPARELPGFSATHPVAVALRINGRGGALPCVPGLPDDLFDHDGQITKAPVRALTLAALAPRPFEHLWDIGGGSGSIGIEWLLAHPSTSALCVERDRTRALRIRENARTLGVDRLEVVEGGAPEALSGLTPPDAVFIGGGLSGRLLDGLFDTLPPGCRLVANAVTLESENLLTTAATERGGTLTRIGLSHAVPIGTKHGWKAAYPIVQWSVVL